MKNQRHTWLLLCSSRQRSVLIRWKTWLIGPAGDPSRSRKAGRGVWDALRGDIRPRCHQRGARLHRADQGHLRPGAFWWNHHPGRLGRREERYCPQRGPLLWGSDQEWPSLPMLIWVRGLWLKVPSRWMQEGFPLNWNCWEASLVWMSDFTLWKKRAWQREHEAPSTWLCCKGLGPLLSFSWREMVPKTRAHAWAPVTYFKVWCGSSF